MSYIAAGAAVVGVGLSAYQAGKGTSKGVSIQYPIGTRRLINDVEFPLLEGNLREQDAYLTPFLQENAPYLQKEYGNVGDIVGSAARKGAKDTGISDLGPVMEGIGGISPELIEALRELAMQRAAQTRTIIPPGYGPFLSPQTITTQSDGGSRALQTGFQAAQAAAAVYSAYTAGGSS